MTNVSRNKKFKAKLIERDMQISKENPVSQMPLPELSEAQSYIIKISGVTNKIRFGVYLKDSAEDLSEGTKPGGLYSAFDQVLWILDNFVTETVSEVHRFELVDGTAVKYSRDGVYRSADISQVAGEPYYVAKIEFLVGQVL